MSINIEKVAERAYNLLKGNGFTVQSHNLQGEVVVDPSEATRFMVDDPNILVRLDPAEKSLTLNTSEDLSDPKLRRLHKMLKQLAQDYLLNFDYNVFDKTIKPKGESQNIAKNAEKDMADVMEELNRIRELSGLIEAKEDCPKCKGSGKKDGEDCKSCSGAGTMYLDGPDYDKEEYTTESADKKVDCPTCEGSGEDVDQDGGGRTCPSCHGQGWEWASHVNEASKKKGGSYATVVEASLSKMTGSAKTSKQQLENVKVIVKHKKAVNEESRGARSRNIQSIFIERAGERFKMAENNLSAARAMARHMTNGGEMHDQVGTAINEMATECKKMKEFVRYVNSAKLINEDNAEYMSLAVEHIGEIKNTFKKLSGSKTYSAMAESIANAGPNPILEDDDDIQSKFTETHFDPRVSNVMGNLASLSYKKKAFESHIDKAIKKENFSNLKSMLSENDAIDFATPQARLSHQVSQLGYSATDESLGAYLHNVSSKINNGGGLSQHEYGTIKSCLSVANHATAASVPTQTVTESYEAFFAQFDV